ncbi:acetoacetate--CoA ligase [Rudaeicoccus suwonensis]|uniref:Acetoacetyl-CoA synthetase n=1 Tax=Rudaeicoccus suwonensis TaxID=657409 RepID=A0A561E363_9MICO|nr:acetoacetate--CoA ligase [Rudaeicoccus suwonensis]TWE10053.1 acetoacetyl-CoA synthetase [Rudaeicoccus suwonensis]
MTEQRTRLRQPGEPVHPGDLIWQPAPDAMQRTRIGQFMSWLAEHRDLEFTSYEQLWQWSVSDLDGFWGALWELFEIRSHAPYEAVLGDRTMPGAQWFPGATLNYAEHLFTAPDDQVAIIARSQTRDDIELTTAQLRDQVARAREVLLASGVRRGDRVAGYLPNVPEALVAFAATASIGAVWASVASEFGPRSVIDRFAQIEPKVLLVAGGYRYGDKDIDRSAQVTDVLAELPSVQRVFDIEYGDWRAPGAESWSAALAETTGVAIEFEPVPFDHPLFVLFSSGTTGQPKAIVHGHGGILLEHLKNGALSWDVFPGDRMLWFTTTAWMMWNVLVSALVLQATAIMVDGNPVHPDESWQWQLAQDTGATIMGASPGFVMASRKAGVTLDGLDLHIRTVGSSGAPMPPEGYAWLQDQLGPEPQICVGSGGTDVCSGLVQNMPIAPVWAGEMSCRCLGVDVHAFDDDGNELIDQLGELVITAPMPSMPVAFWNDPAGAKLRAAYFDHYPGVWRHGDWIVIHADGSSQVAGRSDATLNRGGVRLGTAEFYRVIEEIDGVRDSLVVHLEDPAGGNGELLLFVQTEPDHPLDDTLRREVAGRLRASLSPRHVPDRTTEVPVIPRNLTGKKLELPVKRILQGVPLDQVASRDALADPTSLDAFVALAEARSAAAS